MRVDRAVLDKLVIVDVNPAVDNIVVVGEDVTEGVVNIAGDADVTTVRGTDVDTDVDKESDEVVLDDPTELVMVLDGITVTEVGRLVPIEDNGLVVDEDGGKVVPEYPTEPMVLEVIGGVFTEVERPAVPPIDVVDADDANLVSAFVLATVGEFKAELSFGPDDGVIASTDAVVDIVTLPLQMLLF